MNDSSLVNAPTPELTTQESLVTEPLPTHYACCQTSKSFCGATTAFCGEVILSDQITNDNIASCGLCVALAQRDGCPLGRDCEIVA